MTIPNKTLKAAIADDFAGLNVVFEEVPDHYVLSSGRQRSPKNDKVLREWVLEGRVLKCALHHVEGGDYGSYEYTMFAERHYRSYPGQGYPVRVIRLTDKVPELA